MNQKVLFLSTGMTAGGAERVIATLANGLNARGIEVTIGMIKGDHSAYDLSPGVRLQSAELEPGLRASFQALRFYRELVDRESPDVIASFSTKSDLIALLARILFRVPGRLIVTDRADPYTRSPRMQFACNMLYPRADALVCQSKNVASYYRRKSRRLEISVIPNPINEESIAEPHLHARASTVISVGRLYEQKNHRLAIAAFGRIREAFPELRLKIFGAGPLEAELKQLAAAPHLDGSVSLEGVQPNVIRNNADASLFLFTSEFEGYPNALMEATASGIPAVSTDFSPGTAAEIIDVGVNGYIVPRGDEQAVVAAAIKALSGDLRPEDLEAGARRVRQNHSRDEIVDQWLRVFEGAS